jgi:tetratricopeptide (TPR) repeat protein
MHASARLLLQLDRLQSEGDGNTASANAVREQMETLWYAMTEAEQERLRGLSEDLYAITDRADRRVAMSPDDHRRYGLALQAAMATGNYDEMVRLLRRPPKEMALDGVAFMQGRMWERMGDAETALVFMREAERLNPEEQTISVMIVLRNLGRTEEEEDCARRIVANPHSPPEALYLAAGVLLRASVALSPEEARAVVEDMIAALQRALGPESRRAWPQVPGFRSSASCMLGHAYELLGMQSEALAVYTAALSRNPADTEVLTFRGILLHRGDPAAAVADFEVAATYGAASVWPYYFLARHYALNGQYSRSEPLCITGLKKDGQTPAITAELYELLAVCQAMRGSPPKVVAGSFARALELDPANARILSNRALAMGHGHAPGGSNGPRLWKMPAGVEPVQVAFGLRVYLEFQHERAMQSQQALEPFPLLTSVA